MAGPTGTGSPPGFRGEQVRRVPRWPGAGGGCRRHWPEARPGRRGAFSVARAAGQGQDSGAASRPVGEEPGTLSWGRRAQRKRFRGGRGAGRVESVGEPGRAAGGRVGAAVQERGAASPTPPVSPVPAAAEPVPQGPELPSFGVPCEGLPSSTQDSGRMGQAGLGGPPKRASTPWLWKLCLTYLDNESLHVYLVPRLWFWPHCLRSTHVISLDGFRVRLNPNTLAPPSPPSGGLAEPRTDDGHSVCVCGPFGNEHEPSEWRCGPCTSSVTCGPQGHGSHWGPATCAPHLALGVQEAKGRGVGGGAGLQGLLRM